MFVLGKWTWILQVSELYLIKYYLLVGVARTYDSPTVSRSGDGYHERVDQLVWGTPSDVMLITSEKKWKKENVRCNHPFGVAGLDRSHRGLPSADEGKNKLYRSFCKKFVEVL